MKSSLALILVPALLASCLVVGLGSVAPEPEITREELSIAFGERDQAIGELVKAIQGIRVAHESD